MTQFLSSSRSRRWAVSCLALACTLACSLPLQAQMSPYAINHVPYLQSQSQAQSQSPSYAGAYTPANPSFSAGQDMQPSDARFSQTCADCGGQGHSAKQIVPSYPQPHMQQPMYAPPMTTSTVMYQAPQPQVDPYVKPYQTGFVPPPSQIPARKPVDSFSVYPRYGLPAEQPQYVSSYNTAAAPTYAPTAYSSKQIVSPPSTALNCYSPPPAPMQMNVTSCVPVTCTVPETKCVPVTTYKAVTKYKPVTIYQPVTCYEPCTTYQQQTTYKQVTTYQRVNIPYTCYPACWPYVNTMGMGGYGYGGYPAMGQQMMPMPYQMQTPMMPPYQTAQYASQPYSPYIPSTQWPTDGMVGYKLVPGYQNGGYGHVPYDYWHGPYNSTGYSYVYRPYGFVLNDSSRYWDYSNYYRNAAYPQWAGYTSQAQQGQGQMQPPDSSYMAPNYMPEVRPRKYTPVPK